MRVVVCALLSIILAATGCRSAGGVEPSVKVFDSDLTDSPIVLVSAGVVALFAGILLVGFAAGEPEKQATARVEAAPRPGPPRDPAPAQTAITSRVENRLAIQASVAARAGHCSSAVVTANRLAEIDRELHAKLVATDADLARCYATR